MDYSQMSDIDLAAERMRHETVMKEYEEKLKRHKEGKDPVVEIPRMDEQEFANDPSGDKGTYYD